MDDTLIIKQTRHWVETLVVGLNFCPFAKRELANTRYQVCHQSGMVQAVERLLDECDFLDAHPEIVTSLLILPHFADFELYLQLLDEANLSLDNNALRGTYQLASFHPEYWFEGEAKDSPAHFTNRAPFPALHLLRESSIELAVAKFRDPENIPTRNIATAQKLGREQLQAMLDACKQQS